MSDGSCCEGGSDWFATLTLYVLLMWLLVFGVEVNGVTYRLSGCDSDTRAMEFKPVTEGED